MRKLIAVCGSDAADIDLSNFAIDTAEDIGRLVAEKGGILVCGGRGGIMKAACKGAKEKNGVTIGILPTSKDEANEFVDIAIPTNLGNLRNYIVVNCADIIIAVGGRWGTLNEVSLAMILGKPLILVSGTGGCVDEIVKNRLLQNVESKYYIAGSADEAVMKAFELCDL